MEIIFGIEKTTETTASVQKPTKRNQSIGIRRRKEKK
jgi:hypothetical protein